MNGETQARELVDLLGLSKPPLALTFSDRPPGHLAPFADAMSEPTEDGRTGRVSAGCVFWVEAEGGGFTTVPEDHRNCSVGSLTHGLISLEDAAQGADVTALVESQWVSPNVFPQIPTVQKRFKHISYEPLANAPNTPDVIFLRLNAKQAMQLHAAWPGVRFEGKPQCHIIPIAKEHGEIAVSVGCMLSRVRTGIGNNEMTCAVPGDNVEDLIIGLRGVVAADAEVATYAAEDKERFK